MKKIILLILVLSLTGCVGNTNFSKTCEQTIKSKDITDREIMEVGFNNKDQITNVTITKAYTVNSEEGKNTLSSIKESAQNYNNALLKKEGIKIWISEDTPKKYEIKYEINALKMSEKDLKLFNLQKNSVKFFNKMRTENIECKKN